MNLQKHLKIATALGTLALAVPACGGGDGSNDDSNCEGAKCDTPDGNADENCEKRQAEVLSSSNRGFTPNDIRWACADVEGVNTVNKDDRGQEYCEYYAIFQPPLQDAANREAFDLGRPLGSGTTDLGVCIEGAGGDSCRTTITEDQQFWLEDNPDSVVGACVFTTWHADVPGPLPACEGGCGDEAQVYGFPFTEEFFRMKVSFNSNRAAADLVQKCYDAESSGLLPDVDWDKSAEAEPAQEPFYRGCLAVGNLFGTEWRRSDPSVCAVANRVRECGCSVPGVTSGKELGDALVPPQPAPDGAITKRGFELATWDDREGLPPGCRYANTGENTQSIVLCDMTAADVLGNLNDPKEFCRATYGNNVVVHVPIPAAAITCNPPDTPEAATCGNIPWNIGDENSGPPSGGDTGGDTGGADTGGADTGGTGGADTGGADTGGTGADCTSPQQGAGCGDPCIEECVCVTNGDSFCCETQWDAQCAGEVSSFGCTEACGA